MGELSGYKYREIIKKIKQFGFKFCRQGKGSHEIRYCKKNDIYTTIPKHNKDMPEGTLSAILKEANIKVKDFISK